jgi:hypothetical protein
MGGREVQVSKTLGTRCANIRIRSCESEGDERVKDIFWDKEVNGTSYTKKYVQEVTERSNLAQKKFEEAAAAAIFLPGKIPVIILNLDAELNKVYGSYSYVEELEEKGHLVSGALMELAAQKHLL